MCAVLVCLVAQSCLTLCDPWTVPARLLCPWGFSRQEYWSGLPFPSPGDLPNPGIKTRSISLQADSLSSEPPGKLKNTGVGSLSLLQGIFWTQELNRVSCIAGQILYQLCYQGSPAHIKQAQLMKEKCHSLYEKNSQMCIFNKK